VIFDERDKPVDYRFLELNPVFEQQTGLVNAIGKRVRELVPEHEEYWFDTYGRVARTGQPIRFENRAAQLDRWYDVYAWRYGDPQNRQVAVLFNDVTERKRSEDALRGSEQRLELLAKVAERLLRAENPQVIVEDLCRLVMEYIDCQFFFNYLVDVPGQRMHLNACAGIPEETAESIRQLDFGVAVCGCVAQDRERIIAEDIQNSNDYRTQLVKSFGVQAYCCHPLMMQSRLIGTLSFGTKTRPTFTSDEVALMKRFAIKWL
jgi:PAS domain-containing protein